MKNKFLILTLIILLLMINSTAISALSPTIKAKLDSVQLLMGNKTTLHLEVVKDESKPGDLQLFKNAPKDAFVGVNGDSIELSTNFTTDTLELGSGRIQIDYHIPLQAFDSGYYKLPEFVYVSADDTVKSNNVNLKVLPVILEDDIIEGLPDVESIDLKLTDYLPDVIVDYWWAFITAIILLIVWIWLWKRYKNYGSIIVRKEIIIPPYDEAVAALKKLKEDKLWESNQDKEYYTRLTDILRRYISRRFDGINATEMTSTQLISAIKENDAIKNKALLIRDVLEIADYVKFAKMRTLSEDNIKSYSIVNDFVEDTKPVEIVDDIKDKVLSDEELNKQNSQKNRRKEGEK